MSETLDKLIATLKSEAIEAADKKTKEILDKAREESEKIIKEAEAKRDEMLKGAEEQAEATQEKGHAALRQAARDLNVSVRNDLLKLLGSVLESEVESQLNSDMLQQAVLKVVENVGSGAAITLPANMDSQLADKIRKSLQASDSITEIVTDKSLLSGFRITKTDQGWSYDVTPEEVSEMLYANLSSKWVAIMKENKD